MTNDDHTKKFVTRTKVKIGINILLLYFFVGIGNVYAEDVQAIEPDIRDGQPALNQHEGMDHDMNQMDHSANETTQDAKSKKGSMDHDMSNMDHGAHGTAQDSTSNKGSMEHDMSNMDHGAHGTMQDSASNKESMDHDMGNMSQMDHSGHDNMQNTGSQSTHAGMKGMDHGAMSGMSHGTMQGGSAPANARDPHINSGGYTLVSGPYTLPGPRQIRMADEHEFGSLMFDRLEAVHYDDKTTATVDLRAWYGRDYDRTLLKIEGDYVDHKSDEISSELLWSHAVAAYWDSQLGVRYDKNEGPDRYWLAYGYQGLAPYWFELDITAYLGPLGRVAFNVDAEYELLLTQKLVLQPRIELNAYGKEDVDNGLGAGISDIAVGIRLRYEIKREFAPYFGVEWAGTFGKTADYRRSVGEKTSETKAVAGFRFWF